MSPTEYIEDNYDGVYFSDNSESKDRKNIFVINIYNQFSMPLSKHFQDELKDIRNDTFSSEIEYGKFNFSNLEYYWLFSMDETMKEELGTVYMIMYFFKDTDSKRLFVITTGTTKIKHYEKFMG